MNIKRKEKEMRYAQVEKDIEKLYEITSTNQLIHKLFLTSREVYSIFSSYFSPLEVFMENFIQTCSKLEKKH